MADFDPIEYEENAKARAAAVAEAELAGTIEAEIQKEKVGPAAAYTQAWRAVSRQLPKNLSKAMYLGLLNTAETIDDAAGAVGAAASMSGLPVQPGSADNDKEPPAEQAELPEPSPPAQTLFPEVFEAAHALADEFNEDASTADHIVQGIGQFVIPFTGWLKLMGGLKGASKLQKVGRAVTAEAVTAGSAFDPQEGRIADLLSMGRQMENNFGRLLNTVAPDESAFNAYINMMTDRENEGEWEGRFKNVVDSLTMTGAGAALIKAVPMTLRAARLIAEEAGTVQAGSRKAQRGSIGEETPRILPASDRAAARAQQASRPPLVAKLTPAEKKFFDEIFNSEADLAELREFVPGVQLTDEGLAVPNNEMLGKLADYVEETVVLEMGQGRRLPPSFHSAAFAKKFDRVSGDELTDIERARALKNTVVEEVDGEHIVLEGDDLNTNADVVPIDKDKK